MKKTLLFIFALSFTALHTFAQVYVGDEPKGTNTGGKETNLTKSKSGSSSGSRYKSKYMHLGYLSPKMTPSLVHPDGPFGPDTGPEYGLFFEWGKYRFFSDNFILNEKANIGLYSGTSFGLVKYNFNAPATFTGNEYPFLFVDIKLGPDFRYEITDEFKLDLYGNLGLLTSYGGYVEDEDGEGIYIPTKPLFAFQTGLGLDVSYGKFLIGTQLNFSKGKYAFDIEKEETVSEEYDVLLNSFKVHIGLMFNK